MRILFVYLFICLFNSCKDAAVQSKNIETSKDSLVKLSTKEESKRKNIREKEILIDTLSIKQVTFNGDPFYYKKLNIIKAKIDSVKIQNWECGNPLNWEGEEFEIKYINGAEFISNKKTGEGFLKAAQLKNNILTLSIAGKKFILNKNTHISEIKKLFPNSEIVDLPNDYYTYISMSTDTPENNWIFFYNEKGFLVRFELHWWLC
ncbi:MAG: hypothetical protein JKY08_09900 [Flavobacteriaceae bacterium]|nr:hypothetical protein [Flavobacteriaceae bacterium]